VAETDSPDTLRARVLAAATALPEVSAEGEQHIGFRVRNTTFAWYLDDHHGDGRITLDIKAAPGVQEALVASDPARFHVPAYLGSRGWVGVDLEAPGVNWAEVTSLLRDAYRLTAPKSLADSVG
jgi:hypothetical protein